MLDINKAANQPQNKSKNVTQGTQQIRQSIKLPTKDMLLDKKNRLFLIGIAGILIIFLSDFIFRANDTENLASINGDDFTAYENVLQNADAYTEKLEKDLVHMIESVYGVGSVEIMITIETPGETIYATSHKSTTETQQISEGVTDEKTSYESEYTIIDDGNKDTPIIEMQTLPEIKGVAIVCKGGDDIRVVSDVTELVSVVLGVPTNRICVTKMI